MEALNKSHMSRVAGKIEMIARSATQAVAWSTNQGARQSERSIFTQPFRDGALRAILFVSDKRRE